MSFEELYQEIILDHYRKPRNLCAKDLGQVCVKHENPLCGDELFLYVELDDRGHIGEICFQGHGCSISRASASMMTEAVKGMDRNEALELIETVRLMMHGELPEQDLGDIEALQGLASFPVRIKCALLAWMALKDALGGVKMPAEASHGNN